MRFPVQLLRLPTKGKAEPSVYTTLWLLSRQITLSVLFLTLAPWLFKCTSHTFLYAAIQCHYYYYYYFKVMQIFKQISLHRNRLDTGAVELQQLHEVHSWGSCGGTLLENYLHLAVWKKKNRQMTDKMISIYFTALKFDHFV